MDVPDILNRNIRDRIRLSFRRKHAKRTSDEAKIEAFATKQINAMTNDELLEWVAFAVEERITERIAIALKEREGS
jgi:hypothetical protein